MAQTSQPGCTGKAKTDLTIDCYPFDETERGVLELARRFFGTFAKPESQSWMLAFETAERQHGLVGAIVARRLASTIHAMRVTRKDGFCFMNPDCPCCCNRISQEERFFLMMLHALRRGRQAEARLNAVFLCGGEDPDVLLATMESLANTLAGLETLEMCD